MIEWKQIEEQKPESNTMVLVFMPDCLVTQAYYSGGSFQEPWGAEYSGSKQPKWWASLNTPDAGGTFYKIGGGEKFSGQKGVVDGSYADASYDDVNLRLKNGNRIWRKRSELIEISESEFNQ